MHAPFPRPRNMIEQLERIFGHLGRRVSQQRCIALPHASVIEDETGIFATLVVPKGLGLPLPVPFEGAKAHYPLERS